MRIRIRITTLALVSILSLAIAAGALAQKPPRKMHMHGGGGPPAAPTSVDPGGPPVPVPGTAPTQGMWQTLNYGSPINPVHVALMHTGKLLVIAGSANYPGNNVYTAGVWDPRVQLMTTFATDTDMFCNGMVVLPDGRPFVIGGTKSYDDSPSGFFQGLSSTAIFDPKTEKFTAGPNMSDGRWYPTATVLPNGRVMAISGLTSVGNTLNSRVEVYDPATNRWSEAGTAWGAPEFATLEYFPRQHVLPNGKVFEAGWNPDTHMWDPATHQWTPVATTKFGMMRIYGSSVLLPLRPENGYKPKVILFGGSSSNATNENVPATATSETIDLSEPKPKWEWGPTMVAGRIEMNATMLPNGKVLVSGGSVIDEDESTATLPAELYDPESNTLTPAGITAFPRVYHSNTILLPDATVLSLGGNPIRGSFVGYMEIYSPAYLFRANGSPAPRPAITKHPEAVTYGSKFSLSVSVPDGGAVGSVVAMRPGAVTHAFNMEQRLVGLSFTAAGGTLTVTAPPDANIAPPGHYMIFVLDAKGVPSHAKFVRISS